MTSKQTIVESLPTIIQSLNVISNEGGKSVNLAGKGVSLFLYHESILNDTVRASIEYVDTGSNFQTSDNKNVRESLPIVGTEKVEIKLADNNNTKIGDSPKLNLYVNKITPIGDDARKSDGGRTYVQNPQTTVTKSLCFQPGHSWAPYRNGTLHQNSVHPQRCVSGRNF